MRIFLMSILILLAAIVVVLALLNAEPVELNYFLGKQTLPLSLLLLASMLLGCIATLFGLLKSVLKTRAEVYQLKKRNRVLQRELDNLRAMPVKDD